VGNQGTSTASEVIGIINSPDPLITFSGSTDSAYDNIIGWGTQPNATRFLFTVDPTSPCGHLIPFELTVSAAGDYADILLLDIPVECGPPGVPVDPSPASGDVNVSLDPELSGLVTDPDSDDLTVTFYGREIRHTTAMTFELVVIPDTQYYTCNGHTLSCPNTPFSPYVNDGRITTFISQTQWIVGNKDTIAYVPHVGDLAQNADWYEEEWQRSDTAMDVLETGAPEIPWGLSFGNHDLRNLYGAAAEVTGDTFMNQYFGIDRFSGRPYYGGHFSFNNNSHYNLFEVDELQFIVIHVEYGREYESAIWDWADSLLKQYPTHRGIVVRHAIIDEQGTFVENGGLLLDELKDNPNLTMLLCGHIDGEYIREDVFNNQTIYTILSDYQSEPNGGDGWLRWMQFSPQENQITARSYTPLYDQWDWDNPKATGKRELAYDMGYMTREIASISGVPSGSTVAAEWDNLLPGTRYEWYVTVDDGTSKTISPLWHFTTSNVLYLPLILSAD